MRIRQVALQTRGSDRYRAGLKPSKISASSRQRPPRDGKTFSPDGALEKHLNARKPLSQPHLKERSGKCANRHRKIGLIHKKTVPSYLRVHGRQLPTTHTLDVCLHHHLAGPLAECRSTSGKRQALPPPFRFRSNASAATLAEWTSTPADILKPTRSSSRKES